MRIQVRLLALLLTLCLLCTSFIGCGGTTVPETTTAATTATPTETTTVTEAASETLDIIVDGKAQYSLVATRSWTAGR